MSVNRGCALLSSSLLISSACALDLSGSKQQQDPAAVKIIASAEARLKAAPGDLNAALQLAELYRQNRRLFEAADTYKTVIDRAPNDPRARIGLSDTYNMLGYLIESYGQLQSCLSAVPDQPDCLLMMGNMMRGDGSRQGLLEARRVLSRFLTVAPTHPQAAVARATIQQLELQIAKTPGGPAPNEPIPEAAPPSEDGDDGEAAPGASAAGANPHGANPPAIDPNTPNPHAGPTPGVPLPGHPGGQAPGDSSVGGLNEFGMALQRAIAAVRRNDPLAAEVGFKEALALRPDDPSALSGLAQALAAQGKAKEAVATAEQALAKEPNDIETRWIYVSVLFQAKQDVKKAVEMLRGIVREDPEYAKQSGAAKMLEMVDQVEQKNPELKQKVEGQAPKK